MNQEKIIQAIADVINKKGTDDFGMLPWCKPSDLIAELAAAIAPHLEAGAGWEDAPSWAEWRTVDGNGAITYWKDKPEPSKRNDYWTLAKGDRYEQIPHTVKDWKETLQKRPR